MVGVMHPVLLNIDAGEDSSEPEELYRLADVVSIACGGHAGDDASMERALGLARAGSALAGAHPSYADRAGFGRVALAVTREELEKTVREQCERLAGHARRMSVHLAYVKPHGALYHAANRDGALAAAVVNGARAALGDYTLIAPPHGALFDAARGAGLEVLREGFADRATRPDGSLVPRGEPGAVITDPALAAARARTLAASGTIETVCVHGDTPGAVAVARAVRAVLDPSPS